MIFYKEKSCFTKFPGAFSSPPYRQPLENCFREEPNSSFPWLLHFSELEKFHDYFNVHCSWSGIWKILYFLTLELNRETRIIFYFMQGTFPGIVSIVQNLFLQEGHTGIALIDIRRFIPLNQHQSRVNKETKPNFQQVLCHSVLHGEPEKPGPNLQRIPHKQQQSQAGWSQLRRCWRGS